MNHLQLINQIQENKLKPDSDLLKPSQNTKNNKDSKNISNNLKYRN